MTGITVTTTAIPGMLVLELPFFADDRGWFFESWRQTDYRDVGIGWDFVQDNASMTRKGTLRGLHYQIRRPQGHLVTAASGWLFDAAVDLRPGSPVFGHAETIEIGSENGIMRRVFLPPGVGHGYYALADTMVLYKCTDIWDPEDEGGLLWSDPDIAIAWPGKSPAIKERDAAYPRLRDIPRDRLPQAEVIPQ